MKVVFKANQDGSFEVATTVPMLEVVIIDDTAPDEAVVRDKAWKSTLKNEFERYFEPENIRVITPEPK